MRKRPAILVFFAVAALLLLVQGNRLILTNDEGILLDPAQKLAAGARPYVDFFGYMSPGSYWIQGALFKLFGVSLWVGRVPVILDFSVQCALLFWLTARLASQRAALAAVVVFTGFQIADPSFLTAQHRWDSATLALAALCVGLRFPTVRGFVVAGALQAAAAWCTPSIALVAAAQALWIGWTAERRRCLLPYLSGLAAVTALAVGWLAAKGSLAAFVAQMLWLQRNYATVNVMPYGSVIGGYARLFEDGTGPEKVLRGLFVFCLALPAILPPLAILLWGLVYRRRKAPAESQPSVLLLSMAMIAFTLSAFPRADLFHLGLVAALPYALAAAALAHLLSARAGAIVAFSLIPFSVLFSLNNISATFAVQTMSSPAGSLRTPTSLAPAVTSLLAQVHPGDTLFVHPYMPIFYFVTQGQNPTRFQYLNPGMMTAVEETEVLSSLKSHPPQWLLYMRLTDQEFRRVFPNSANTNVHFAALESWLDHSYAPMEKDAVDLAGYRLYHRIALP